MTVSTSKVIFIDVETTGTNPELNGLTQVSGCIQIDDQVRESFDYYLRPFPRDVIEDAALKVTGLDRRQFLLPDDPNFLHVDGQDFVDPYEVFTQLKQLLANHIDQYDKNDKFQFVGYNAHSFDMPFMRKFWEKNNDRFFGSWFWYPCLDVMLLWAQILQPERAQLTNFKLATVARHCGIEVDDSRLHDSQYDIELTRELWLIAREIIDRGRVKKQPEVQGTLFDF